MVGSFADVVISDAIVNSIPGFDLNTAVDAILKDVHILFVHLYSFLIISFFLVL